MNTPTGLLLSSYNACLAAHEAAEAAYQANTDDLLEDSLEACVETTETALEAAAEALTGSNEPRPFFLSEEGVRYSTFMASSVEEALEEARSNVDRANYDGNEDVIKTLWVDVRVICEITEEEGSDTVACDPEEPDCEDDQEHDWSNDADLVGVPVNGNGGGVIVRHGCRNCGCGRITNTWDHHPGNGTQGLTSVTYTPGEYSTEEEDCDEAAAE